MAAGYVAKFLAVGTGIWGGIYVFSPYVVPHDFDKQANHIKTDQPGTSITKQQESANPVLRGDDHTTGSLEQTLATTNNLPADQIRLTEERVANAGGATRIPSSADRWAEIQQGQLAKVSDTTSWSKVPLNKYTDGKGQSQDSFGR